MSLDCVVQALIRKQFIGRMPLISVKLYKNFTYQNDYKKPSKELHDLIEMYFFLILLY
jgi:hypothetical protein